jgi:hypothetical protein
MTRQYIGSSALTELISLRTGRREPSIRYSRDQSFAATASTMKMLVLSATANPTAC